MTRTPRTRPVHLRARPVPVEPPAAMPTAPLDTVIADDSALYRQLLRNVVSRLPDTRVVGLAENGDEAVEMVARLRPHVLTLDVNMPGRDGIAVLREVRRLGCDTRVVMVSSLTGEGTPLSVEALLLGAFEVVGKPAGVDPHEARQILQGQLAEKFALVRKNLGFRRDGAAPSTPVAIPAGGRYAALALGASTGGPEALREILPRLPADLPVPVLIVQHILAPFSPVLAARLRELSQLPIAEAEEGMAVEPGRMYLAPAGSHLRVERRGGGVWCRLDHAPPLAGCRPSFDILLESVCGAFDGRVLAAVLSGMGSDGAAGCRLARACGGFVVAQHRDTCTVWGMPKAVEEQGLADAVVRVGEIAGVLTERLRRPAPAG